MKRMRILGLALVAVFALAAVVASGASAAPAFFECAKTSKNAEKKYEGKYTDKLCSSESPTKEGKYELKEGIGKGKGLKGSAPGTSKLHTNIPGKGDVPVECAKAKDTASVEAPNKIVKAVTVFSKCKAAGAPCQSGSKKETIETVPLSGELGIISASPLKVGVVLTPESETYFAQFDCTGVAHVRTMGAVIGQQTGDINTISKESTLSFTVENHEFGFGPSPINNPQKFEGEAGSHILMTELEAEGSEKFEPPGGLPSGQEGTINNKGEALMVKA
jgi:hypothetical protein